MKKDIDNFLNQAKSYLKDDKLNKSPLIDIKKDYSISQGLLTPIAVQHEAKNEKDKNFKYKSFVINNESHKNNEPTLKGQDTGNLTLNMKSCDSLNG